MTSLKGKTIAETSPVVGGQHVTFTDGTSVKFERDFDGEDTSVVITPGPKWTSRYMIKPVAGKWYWVQFVHQDATKVKVVKILHDDRVIVRFRFSPRCRVIPVSHLVGGVDDS